MPRTRDLIRSYVDDLNIGDVFSIEDIISWFKSTWPRMTPSGNGVGSLVRGLGNVQIVSCGIYKVIA